MSLVKSIRALDRGLKIIELIAARSSASLHELHLATGLPKATLLRILYKDLLGVRRSFE